MPKVIGFMLSFVNPVFILLFVLKMAANIKKDCSDHLLGTLLATRIRWRVISLQQQTMKGRGQKHHHNHIIVAIITLLDSLGDSALLHSWEHRIPGQFVAQNLMRRKGQLVRNNFDGDHTLASIRTVMQGCFQQHNMYPTTTPLSCCSMFVHVMVLVYHDIPVSMVQDRGLFLKRSAWGVASQSAGAGQAVCLPDAAPREWHGLDAWLAEEGKWI